MQFIDKGGSVMIMLGEGGEAKYGTNINFLLEEYGIMINPDAVCRYLILPCFGQRLGPCVLRMRRTERCQDVLFKLMSGRCVAVGFMYQCPPTQTCRWCGLMSV